MLFWGSVPGNVVEVVADGSGFEVVGIADDGVEVALGGGDEVDIVHENCSREVLPSPYAVFEEGTSEHNPC